MGRSSSKLRQIRDESKSYIRRNDISEVQKIDSKDKNSNKNLLVLSLVLT